MKIKNIIISSLSVLLLSAFTSVANAACGKLVIAEQNWASAELMANVDKIILEKGYGCEVELIPGATMPTFTSMDEKGEPDMNPEQWANAVYTPLKQITPWAVFAGAFPGAIPPMLGYVAYSNSFGLEAGLLFALQFMWQFPHFWAIAWKADEDYAKAGFRLLPSKGGKDMTSAFLILLYSLFLLLVSLLPFLFGLAGNVALYVTLFAGLIMIWPSIRLFRLKTDKEAMKVMFASFIYIPIVLIAWYLDKI